MADKEDLTLQQFIASLDATCLPKILQVSSGVYFQGSVYELSGIDVCFATGDLIKIIGLEPLAVCCEDTSNNEKFELPINHTGLFKVVPEVKPYRTIEEMLSRRPVCLESCLPFKFVSHSNMKFDNFTLGAAGRTLTGLSMEQNKDGEDQLRCHVKGIQKVLTEVRIPLSSHGEFTECEIEECFTLQEIVSSPRLRQRRFRPLFVHTKCEQNLVLTPIYQLQAIMQMRGNVVKFLSSLEVDVVDVTESCKHLNFAYSKTLAELLSQPHESFPAVVEILEGPVPCSLFKSSWLQELKPGIKLIFHETRTSSKILLSSSKSRKLQQFFLVSQQYGGRFRRRPREFNSVYELYIASIQEPGLKVTVTRNCEDAEEEGLPDLTIGEQLEVVCYEMMELPCESGESQKQSVEVLLCQRLQEPDDGDSDDGDEGEMKQGNERAQIYLPLYMQGHFVEVLTHNKKYSVKQLGTVFSLPMELKVVNRDTELENDPLVAFACLRVEGVLSEPTIQASFPHKPQHCFEIPAKWLSMSVSFTEEPLPWPDTQPPTSYLDKVTEVTNIFYYEFVKQENSGDAPPPRPPKICKTLSKPSNQSAKGDEPRHKPGKSCSTKKSAELTLEFKRRPPAPQPPDEFDHQPAPLVPRKHLALSVAGITPDKARPNTNVKMESKKNVLLCDISEDEDCDHEYESLNETFEKMMKNA